MHVQPLFLTSLSGRPAIDAGPRLSGASVDGSSSGKSQRAGERSSAAGVRDTVEISAEAEAELLGQLSEDAQRVVRQLKDRDREVRAHEQAHLAAAGPYATGGPTYTYATGPDGQRYAVGGEVGIDSSPIPDDPEATIRKAQVIRAAATAPADPSGQDRQVAAAAAKMEAQATQELRQLQQAEASEATESVGKETAAAFLGAKESQATDPSDGRSGFEQFVGALFDAVA